MTCEIKKLLDSLAKEHFQNQARLEELYPKCDFGNQKEKKIAGKEKSELYIREGNILLEMRKLLKGNCSSSCKKKRCIYWQKKMVWRMGGEIFPEPLNYKEDEYEAGE